MFNVTFTKRNFMSGVQIEIQHFVLKFCHCNNIVTVASYSLLILIKTETQIRMNEIAM